MTLIEFFASAYLTKDGFNASKVKSSAKESSNPVEKAFLNALKEPKLESIENSVQAQAGHVLFHNAKIAHQMDNQNKKPSIELKSSS